MANFMPALLDSVLVDYSLSITEARDLEVLFAMATIVNMLKVRPHSR